jgi:predicted RNA methylase
MKNFINYLKKENILEAIIKNSNLGLLREEDKKFIENLLENIQKEINHYDKSSDLLGSLYENALEHEERKRLGEFYTPTSVVNYILNAIGYKNKNDIDNKKIVDLSCGSGSFIIQAIRVLLNCYKKIYNRKQIYDFTKEEAEIIIQKVKENIYGVDINPIACVLCQINIHLLMFELYEIMKKDEKNYKFPQFNIININALNFNLGNVFDFVIGNPPYLFIRDIPPDHRKLIENSDFVTNKGQYDYYQIFIELGVKLLRNKGKLGYIVPDSILALSNRSLLRSFIYNTTKIKEIYQTGSKFDDPVVSNIILILEKEENQQLREKNTIKVKLSSQVEKEIHQGILKQWDFKFLIHLDDTDISILENLDRNFPKLKDLNKKKEFKFSLSRGVELAKTGEIVFCERCELYFPVPKKALICTECKSRLKSEHIESIIYPKIPKKENNNLKRFISSINRYEIKEKNYIDISKEGINYKNLDIYDNRIIIRQLSQNNLICATYDENLALTSQSFYNLKIIQTPLPEFNNFYMLGIINSKLLSYYFIKSFGSYKELFPRILIEKIKNLPIKIPETNEEKHIVIKISKKVKHLLSIEEKNSDIFLKTQDEVDSLIFDLYQISEEDRKYIMDFIENTEKL